jgi:hypothetical protein
MLTSLDTLNSALENLVEFGSEARQKAGTEVLRSQPLSVPKVIHTPGGLVGTLEMGGVKTTCFITKPKENSWGKTLRSFSPEEVDFIQGLFQKDTMATLESVWDKKSAQAYYKGATGAPTGGIDELCVRAIMCFLAGDILYWRTMGEMFLRGSEEECAEVDMLVRAKKAQLYYTHATMCAEQVGERLGIHVVIGEKTKSD